MWIVEHDSGIDEKDLTAIDRAAYKLDGFADLTALWARIPVFAVSDNTIRGFCKGCPVARPPRETALISRDSVDKYTELVSPEDLTDVKDLRALACTDVLGCYARGKDVEKEFGAEEAILLNVSEILRFGECRTEIYHRHLPELGLEARVWVRERRAREQDPFSLPSGRIIQHWGDVIETYTAVLRHELTHAWMSIPGREDAKWERLVEESVADAVGFLCLGETCKYGAVARIRAPGWVAQTVNTDNRLRIRTAPPVVIRRPRDDVMRAAVRNLAMSWWEYKKYGNSRTNPHLTEEAWRGIAAEIIRRWPDWL